MRYNSNASTSGFVSDASCVSGNAVTFGDSVGAEDGGAEGTEEGAADGGPLIVGGTLGLAVGAGVGDGVGFGVGRSDGVGVGLGVGAKTCARRGSNRLGSADEYAHGVFEPGPHVRGGPASNAARRRTGRPLGAARRLSKAPRAVG